MRALSRFFRRSDQETEATNASSEEEAQYQRPIIHIGERREVSTEEEIKATKQETGSFKAMNSLLASHGLESYLDAFVAAGITTPFKVTSSVKVTPNIIP